VTGKKNIRQEDHREIKWEKFEEAVREVLLKPIAKKSRYVNKEPAKKELEAGYKLEKRRG